MDATSDIENFLTSWQGPAIGLMDLDAFFASVEVLDHPEWRGKPVIVGGSPKHRGVVSTCSYEARAFGVHSAMPSWQAEKLCPGAIWTHGHYARYSEVSREVMSILKNETPRVQQVSIDEAFFDITPGRFSKEDPIAICRRIQEAVADLGVSCSIGLSVNKTVSKIASERQKPRGFTVVLPGLEREFLAPLPVSAMSGIGKRTTEVLHEMGILTLGDLAEADPKLLEQKLGTYGPSLCLRAQGLERSEVPTIDTARETKSVSSERTFDKDLKTRRELTAAIRYTAGLTATRLRKEGLLGQRVTLKLKTDNHHTKTVQTILDEPTDDEHIFGEAALDLLDKVWTEGTGVRLVGVGMSMFDHFKHTQLSLFDEDIELNPTGPAEAQKAERLKKLGRATDALIERFGKDAIHFGREYQLGKGFDHSSQAGTDDEE